MNLLKLLTVSLALIVAGCGGHSNDTPPPLTDSQEARVNCTAPAVKHGNTCVTPNPTPTCTAPQVLVNGVCTTPTPTCTAPKVLVNGVCTTPAPPPPTCTPPQVLVNGVCTTPTPTCTAPQVLVNGVCTTPTPPPPTTPGPTGQDAAAWTLTFGDEFDGTALNTTKFNDHLWYETSDGVKNYEVAGGSLKIWPDTGFVSRNIDTDGKFSQLYGFFEIEAKLPYGKGTWPAWWLYSHPCESTSATAKCRPEVDMFEAYAGGGPNSGWSTSDFHPNNFGVTIHEANGDYSFHAVPYATKMRDFAPYNNSPVDLSAGWHKYGLKWEPSGMTFYFDGQQLGPKWNDTAGYFNQPMYILFSLAFGSASGTPDSSTPTGSSNSFDVRYLRVWQAK